MNGWKLFVLFVGVGVLAGAGVSNVRRFAASSTTLCGNRILEPGEQCERGIACPAGAGCANCQCVFRSSSSAPSLCGNGNMDTDEVCDIGFPCPDGYRCDTCRCLLNETSPSNVTGSTSTVLFLSSEQSVSSSMPVFCGDGRIDPGEICEVNVGCPYGKICELCQCLRRASSSMPAPRCGNGKLEGSEICESSLPCPTGFKCSETCLCRRLPAPIVCGNGVLESGEDCDSGYACTVGTRCENCRCRSDFPSSR